MLKKFCMVVKRDTAGNIGSGLVNFEARTPIANEIFVQMQFMR